MNFANARRILIGYGDAVRIEAVWCKDLRKTLPSGTEVLRGVDLLVGRGELVALTGPSGSGKTSLLHALAGIDTGFSGECRVLGLDPRGVGSRNGETRNGGPFNWTRLKNIGLIFQEGRLLDGLTAVQNAALPGVPFLGRRGAERRAMELLERMGVEGVATASPRSLSSGERQRVAVARAMVNRPSLLLADEPTGSLDSLSGAAVHELIGEAARSGECAVLMVTHDSGVAGTCERVLNLFDGRLDIGIKQEGA